MLEVAFVLAPRQNLFFVELQRALATELERQGVRATLAVGAYPPPRRGRVYALMPPHEYFTLMDGRIGPPPEVHGRTIFICGEQPDSDFFASNLKLAELAGAMVDINRLAIRAYRHRGIEAQHLQLGYTPAWDFLPEAAGTAERDIDVLFMGAASDRRLRHLAAYARTLRHRRCRWVISDNARPNWAPSGSFLTEGDKWELFGRAKVLINLHQDETPYFEWLRIVQAMTNGCAIVTESSLDSQPLVPGDHMLVGRPEALGHLAERLLDDDHGRWRMQTAAYEFLRSRLPLGDSVGTIVDAARRLDERPVPSPDLAFFRQPPPRLRDVDETIAGFASAGSAHESATRRALKDLRLEVLDLRRRLERLGAERRGPVRDVVVEHISTGWWTPPPRVSVLVTLYNYERHIEAALDSLLASGERSWEVIVVDDGSRDGSLARATRWLRRHDHVAGIVLTHPINRGLARARNAALDFARGECCFVLDADNAVLPTGLGVLLAALDADPEAAFAYGLLERFTARGPIGLSNIYPWEPERFRDGNYIDAMALIRTHALRAHGGYRTDRRLYGWEDYDLWCRMAEAGEHGAYVPAVVARYRTTEHSMLSITNISATDAVSIIAEASPTVMGGAAAAF